MEEGGGGEEEEEEEEEEKEEEVLWRTDVAIIVVKVTVFFKYRTVSCSAGTIGWKFYKIFSC